MDSQQQKRKLQDEDKEISKNKKQHNETDITFENVGADSTHIDGGDQSKLVNSLVESEMSDKVDEEEEADESLLRTVVKACTPSSEENVALQELVKSLKDVINKKDKNMNEQKYQNVDLENKVARLEKNVENFKVSATEERIKLDKYKRTILALNKIAKVREAKAKEGLSSEVIERKDDDANTAYKAEKVKHKSNKCKYEDEGKCKDGTNCQFLHPRMICQYFSKIGSCPTRKVCKFRHPSGICFEWEQNGNCLRGDKRRF